MIAIDCGLRGCGVAQFKADTLIRAAYVKNTAKTERGPATWVKMAQAVFAWACPASFEEELVIEYQRLRFGREKGDPNNMMELQGVVGAITGVMFDWNVVGLFPEQWKGSVKKEIMTGRIIQRLSLEELNMLEVRKKAKNLIYDHNMVDAVGIGLHHLGRLEPIRKIERS